MNVREGWDEEGRDGKKGNGEEREGQGRRREREERGEEERSKAREEERFKIAFWNVVGLNNKDEEFWKELNEWDVMMLMETWVDEKGWEKIRDKLPKGYREKQWAGRKNKKGTAIGGLIVGIRRGVEVGKEKEDREVEGIMSIKIQVKGR